MEPLKLGSVIKGHEMPLVSVTSQEESYVTVAVTIVTSYVIKQELALLLIANESTSYFPDAVPM